MKTESEDITKYAICSIRWKDDGVIEDGYVFKLSLDLENEEEDERVFYYCNDPVDIEYLTQEDNGEDFVILKDSIQYIKEL